MSIGLTIQSLFGRCSALFEHPLITNQRSPVGLEGPYRSAGRLGKQGTKVGTLRLQHLGNLAEDASIDERLDSLYRDQAESVTAALRRDFGDGPPDPEDITQQAFFKILERGNWQDIRNLRSFLWRTARNLMLDGKRNVKVPSKYDFEVEQLFFPQRGSDLSPENVIYAMEELDAVNEALEQMPDRRRRAFVLHRIEGIPVAEVARRIALSETATRKHIARAVHEIEMHLERRKPT